MNENTTKTKYPRYFIDPPIYKDMRYYKLSNELDDFLTVFHFSDKGKGGNYSNIIGYHGLEGIIEQGRLIEVKEEELALLI